MSGWKLKSIVPRNEFNPKRLRARISKYLFSKYAKLKIEPIISSELPFSPDSIEEGSTLVAISQSGESADVLEAV